MELIIKIPDEDYKYICKIAKDLKGRAVLPTDWKAIANSTPYNPTGDCISREDLKKALDKKALDLANGGMIIIESINRIIDNAQAVEFSLLPLSGEADDAYMRGYEVGKAEGILKANTRPQGEWSEFEGGYRCSNCDDIEVYTPNFCPNCGADMRTKENLNG